jgi:hypothetical protein|tara:strand:+ start:14608 stop:15144 length:537 start_codon:yes stop_codon:yes gene_type:complete
VGLNKRQRDNFYPIVMEQQKGEYCSRCGHTPESLLVWGFDALLIIDHKDNNSRNNKLENLQLLCRGCNRRKNPHRPKSYERAETPEFATSKVKERLYRNWIKGKIMTEPHHISVEDAINSGAEYCEISQITVRRYLQKLTSKEGLYTLGYHNDGESHVYEKGTEPYYDDPAMQVPPEL